MSKLTVKEFVNLCKAEISLDQTNETIKTKNSNNITEVVDLLHDYIYSNKPDLFSLTDDEIVNNIAGISDDSLYRVVTTYLLFSIIDR